jgi:hypothetical protein
MRPGLIPGHNVDRLDIAAGLREARLIGYDDGKALMVAEYALQRWARGEEDGAQQTWLHEYPNDLTSFTRILAAAAAGGARQRPRYRLLGRWPNEAGIDCYWWEGPHVDSRVEQINCSVEWFWRTA